MSQTALTGDPSEFNIRMTEGKRGTMCEREGDRKRVDVL